MNKFYVAGEQRGERVRDLFARVARRYDLINDLQSAGLHRRWKRKLVELSQGRSGERALDLCCGTGDVALAFAREAVWTWWGWISANRCFGGGQESVQSSKFEVKSWGAGAVFLQGTRWWGSRSRTGVFDVATMSYGLRNLADFGGWVAGEMLRVTRPGRAGVGAGFWQAGQRGVAGGLFWLSAVVRAGVGADFCGDDAETHGLYFGVAAAFCAWANGAWPRRWSGAWVSKNTRLVNLLGGVMSINYGQCFRTGNKGKWSDGVVE